MHSWSLLGLLTSSGCKVSLQSCPQPHLQHTHITLQCASGLRLRARLQHNTQTAGAGFRGDFAEASLQ